MAAIDPKRSERTIRRALAAATYRDDRIRLSDGDLRGQSCLIASRQGVFAATPAGAKRIAHGFFFGLCRHHDAIYAFEACGAPSAPTQQGRIVRFTVREGQIADAAVVARGLDNQCHQIAVIDDLLHVVDTANQAIARYTLDGMPLAPLTPFPIAPRDDMSGAYLHLNAIRAIGEQIVVMLHNGKGPARPSELAWIDRAGRLLRRMPLAGHGCHDIEVDEHDVIWCCGSLAGEVIDTAGRRFNISDRMTRGLAITQDRMIVGTSMLGARLMRSDLRGSVLFLERDFRRLAELDLPGAPTDLIAL